MESEKRFLTAPTPRATRLFAAGNPNLVLADGKLSDGNRIHNRLRLPQIKDSIPCVLTFPQLFTTGTAEDKPIEHLRVLLQFESATTSAGIAVSFTSNNIDEVKHEGRRIVREFTVSDAHFADLARVQIHKTWDIRLFSEAQGAELGFMED